MAPGRFFWILLAALGLGLILLVANSDSGETFGMANEDFGRTLYLGLLAIVIAAGLLGSGMRLGGMVRNIAIWVLIVLVLMTGYLYRYELQDVASRLSAGLVPGSPLTIGETDGRATVTLVRGGGGHFTARAEVNGTPVDLLVDTGATATVLTMADARRAGLGPETLSFTVPIATANGIAQAARTVAEEIAIGTIARRNQTVMVVEDGMLGQSLLGMTFIGSLSGFDMRGERLILRD